MIDKVLQYLDRGFNIVQIPHKQKGPVMGWEHFQYDRVTEEVAKKWWTLDPKANIGLVTGEISGTVVVDIDSKEGYENVIKVIGADNIKNTLIAKTGGGGYHLFYKHPNDGKKIANSVGIFHGVDIRADGGIIVLPPSIHHTGNVYMWLNNNEIQPLPKDLEDILSKPRGKGLTKEDWETSIGKGSRNQEMTRRVGKLFQLGMKLDEIIVITESWNEMHCNPPLPAKEIKAMIDSIYKRETIKENVDSMYDLSIKKEFFNGSMFIPSKLAIKMLDMFYYRYMGDRLWVYESGVYRPIGESHVRYNAQKILKDETRDSRISEVLHYIERDTVCEFQEQETKYVNVANGRLDWKKGILEPHNPEIIEIMQIPASYDPKAKCKNFDSYLETTLDKDLHKLIEEIMGYCLIPSTKFEKAIMLTGEGANGKSVFLETLQYLLGLNNVCNIELQELEENRFKKAELLGKLANIFTDLSNKSMQTSSAFKILVTGERITAERKFGHPFEFTSFARLLFSANELPQSSDKSYAFERRWIIIPFERTFDGKKADRNLKYKIRKELSGVLNRGIKGLKRLFKNSAFSQNKKNTEALKNYRIINDSVAAFIEDCCELKDENITNKQEFYNDYSTWCYGQGLKPVSSNQIKPSLQRQVKDLGEIRNKTGRCWRGVKIVDIDAVNLLEH